MKDDSDPFRPLVERFQSGTAPEESFRPIFESFYQPVVLYFRRHGFDPEESRDLAQETFFQVLRNLPTFRFESSFSSWVFAVAVNVHRSELRRRSAQKRDAREIVILDPETRSPDPGPLRLVLSSERDQALQAALQSLPEQMRRCATLYLRYGLKYREIATILNVSIETVKAHLFQAKRRLRDQLADYFEELGESVD